MRRRVVAGVATVLQYVCGPNKVAWRADSALGKQFADEAEAFIIAPRNRSPVLKIMRFRPSIGAICEKSIAERHVSIVTSPAFGRKRPLSTRPAISLLKWRLIGTASCSSNHSHAPCGLASKNT